MKSRMNPPKKTEDTPSVSTANPNAGHRQRLRERFLKAGLDGLNDYEVVDLLLTLGTPRRDCKQAAKEAIKHFGSLRAVLEASPAELSSIKGIGEVNSMALTLIREVSRRYLKDGIMEKLVCNTAQQVFDYLYCAMRGLKKEVFKVIYLDSQHRVLEVADLFSGTVASGCVIPREVIGAAISQNASALIFVHNHPSGKTEPSQADKDLTRELVYAAMVMKIRALDHIIIGDNCYFSFAAAGLMGEYETGFLNLKLKHVSEAKRHIYRAELFGGNPE